MPKISATYTKTILIKYFIKIICSTAVSLALLSIAVSFVFQKLDLDLSHIDIVSVVIVIFSAVITSSIGISQFNNNLLVISCMAVLPLALFVFVNSLINNSSTIILIVKLFGTFLSAILVSFIKSAKKR